MNPIGRSIGKEVLVKAVLARILPIGFSASLPD
jgi:hypothetical protein